MVFLFTVIGAVGYANPIEANDEKYRSKIVAHRSAFK